MADTRVLEARAVRRGGSSPLLGTNCFFKYLAHNTFLKLSNREMKRKKISRIAALGDLKSEKKFKSVQANFRGDLNRNRFSKSFSNSKSKGT
jgi:hypothetical protein